MKRLIEQTACDHGKYEEHVTMRGQAAPRCPGGSSREVTVDELALAKYLYSLRDPEIEWESLVPVVQDLWVLHAQSSLFVALSGGR